MVGRGGEATELEANEPFRLRSGVVLRFGQARERFTFRVKGKKRGREGEGGGEGAAQPAPPEKRASVEEDLVLAGATTSQPQGYVGGGGGSQQGTTAVGYDPFAAIFGNRMAQLEKGGGGTLGGKEEAVKRDHSRFFG